MKIGICAFPLSRGKETGRGLDRTFDEIAKGFSRKKIKFDYYHLGFIAKEFAAIFSSWRFYRLLKATKDDIYLAVYPVAAIFPVWAKKRPFVTGIHDMIPFHVFGYNNRLKYAFKRWAIKFAARRSDHIIVGLATTKTEVMRYFDIPAEKISVVPYGIDHKNYYLDKKIKKILYRVAFLGEAKRAKGMDTIIKAFVDIREQVPQAKLVLASRGAEFEKMKELARELLPDGSFEFVGFVPENKMREFYAKTDVFVFPSRHGFGLSSLEAMASGTPTVVSDVLDARDVFTDEDMLADPEQPKVLAEKIIRLLNNRKLYSEKRKEALKIASQYTWERTADGYFQVCQDVLNKKANSGKKDHMNGIEKLEFIDKAINWLTKSLSGKVLRILVSISLVIYLIFSIDWQNVGATIKSLNILILLIAFILNFLVEFFSIKRHQLILRKMGTVLSFWQVARFYFLGLLASLILPAGADVSKLILLKTRAKIGLKTGALSLIFDRLFGFLGLLTVLAVSIIVAGIYHFKFIKGWPVWLACFFLLSLILISVLGLKKDYKTVSHYLNCLYLSVIYQFLIVVTIYLIAWAINREVLIGWYFIAIPIISFGSMLPVSVGGLGVREWLFVVFAPFLLLSRESALSISLILWFFWVFEGIFGLLIYLRRENLKKNV